MSLPRAMLQIVPAGLGGGRLEAGGVGGVGVPGGSDIDTHPLCVEWMRVLLLLGGLVSLLPTSARHHFLPASALKLWLVPTHSQPVVLCYPQMVKW